MHKFIAAAPLLLALTLQPALAQSVGEKTGVNKVTGVSPSTGDFVAEVAAGNMFEVQSSQIAVQKSDQADMSFAQKMIADHQKAESDLQTLVSNGTVSATIPSTLPASKQKMLDKLNTLNGDGFSRKFRMDQIAAHKDTISLFQRYAKNGDNAQLKSWASTMLPTLQDHLQMAQALSK